MIANHFDSKLGDQNADGRFQYPEQSSTVQRATVTRTAGTSDDISNTCASSYCAMLASVAMARCWSCLHGQCTTSGGKLNYGTLLLIYKQQDQFKRQQIRVDVSM